MPLTFGSEWTSATADTFSVVPGFATITIDTTVNVADAWGTVRLPAGDYQAIRVRSDSKTSVQTIVAGQVITSDSFSDISYTWLSEDAYIVLSISSEDDETDPNFTTASSFTRLSSGQTTPNERVADLPGANLRLEPYPNPSRHGSTIAYRIPRDGHVELAVYDVLGHRVRTLVDAPRPSGEHSVRWNGVDARGDRVAAGVYLIRLNTGTTSTTRKVSVLR